MLPCSRRDADHGVRSYVSPLQLRLNNVFENAEAGIYQASTSIQENVRGEILSFRFSKNAVLTVTFLGLDSKGHCVGIFTLMRVLYHASSTAPRRNSPHPKKEGQSNRYMEINKDSCHRNS